MAIANDSRNTGAQTLAAKVTGATSVSWTHTLGSLSDAMLIVCCAQDATGASTGVNWDDGGTNAAMAKKGGVITGFASAEVWFLANPAVTGAKTIRVSWSGSNQGQGASASYSGVNGFNAASPQTATGASGTNPSLNVTTTSGELAIDSAVQDLGVTGDVPTKGASQTYIGAGLNTTTNSIESGHSEQAASGASTTMTWTMKPSGGAWAQVGVSLVPAGGAAATWGPLLGGQNNRLVKA